MNAENKQCGKRQRPNTGRRFLGIYSIMILVATVALGHNPRIAFAANPDLRRLAKVLQSPVRCADQLAKCSKVSRLQSVEFLSRGSGLGQCFTLSWVVAGEVSSSNATALYSLDEVFQDQLRRVGDLNASQLNALHQPAFAKDLGFSVHQAQYYQQFDKVFGLSPNEKEKLSALGFVVLPSGTTERAFYNPIEVYYQVYNADLPVFISADSILHAWHRTYNDTLMQIERDVLAGKLAQLLKRSLATLNIKKPDEADAAWYLNVALGALANAKTDLPIDSFAPADILCFGESRSVDFGLYRPRGHYNETKSLQGYFKAMMWLGQAGCPFVLYDSRNQAQPIPHPRQEAAARALVRAMKQSGALSDWNLLSGFYDALVGRTGRLSPNTLAEACENKKLGNCQGTSAELKKLYQELAASHQANYRQRRPNEPLILSLFGQRFAYDAWVMSHAIAEAEAMPKAEEISFVLGADRSLARLQQRMTQDPTLPARLEALRRTLEIVSPTDLDDSVYNHTLAALMALAKTRQDARHPAVFNTAAWHDRKIEAVLAAWAEIRHDNVLAVEPSEGEGCLYPLGYADPIPDFYQDLGQAAKRMNLALASLGLLDKTIAEPLHQLLTHWQDTMRQLEQIAKAQLDSAPLTQGQLDFFKNTLDAHLSEQYEGTRTYDGWYPKLYHPEHGRPNQTQAVVVDVHTRHETREALEVGSGEPGLIIVAINQGAALALYGGPGYNFYEFTAPTGQRMTDWEFGQKLRSDSPPPKPDFTKGYWSNDPPIRTTENN